MASKTVAVCADIREDMEAQAIHTGDDNGKVERGWDTRHLEGGVRLFLVPGSSRRAESYVSLISAFASFRTSVNANTTREQATSKRCARFLPSAVVAAAVVRLLRPFFKMSDRSHSSNTRWINGRVVNSGGTLALCTQPNAVSSYRVHVARVPHRGAACYSPSCGFSHLFCC